MKLRYFGHSAFEIAVGDTTVLLDPFITGNPLAEGIVTAEELRPDVILVTHAHQDHWGDTIEIAKRTDATVVANFEITQFARRHGHENVLAMNTGGSVMLPWGTVTQTHARHSSSFPDGSYGGHPGGYIVHSQGRTLYALGDTSPFAEMAWIGEDYEIDVALVPVGDCFTMGPTTSIRAMQMIRPAVTIPIHYNTFPAIEIDVEDWRERAGKAGFVVNVMPPGGVLDL